MPHWYLSEGLANRTEFSIVDIEAHSWAMLRLAKFGPLSIDLMVSQFDTLVVAMADVRPVTQTGVS